MARLASARKAPSEEAGSTRTTGPALSLLLDRTELDQGDCSFAGIAVHPSDGRDYLARVKPDTSAVG